MVASCSTETRKESPENLIRFSTQLAAGQWHLDSSGCSVCRFELFLLEDSSCYIFSRNSGGELMATARLTENDSLILHPWERYRVSMPDSTHLLLEDVRSGNCERYRRSFSDDFHRELQEKLRADSLRSELLGWWKMKTVPRAGDGSNTIQFLNTDRRCAYFSMYFREDGELDIHPENSLDELIVYNYEVNDGNVELQKYCVGDRYPVSIGTDDKLYMIMRNQVSLLDDTLEFERLRRLP